jgi:hypothetical protein
MTTSSERPDAGLGERLRELDAGEMPTNEALIEQMFASMKSRCDESDHTIAGFLRSRSTLARRAIVLVVFVGLALAGWFMFPVIAEEAQTMQWTASLVAFCLLIVLAMFMVTRPVHLPELPRWQSISLACVAVAATVVAAFWPVPEGLAAASTHDHGGGFMAGACMGVGLLLGVPVYALLRLVDRGNALGSLVAAAAAGVAGNFVLKAHCSIAGTSHELLGHASVAVLFVVGLGLVHRVIPSK